MVRTAVFSDALESSRGSLSTFCTDTVKKGEWGMTMMEKRVGMKRKHERHIESTGTWKITRQRGGGEGGE